MSDGRVEFDIVGNDQSINQTIKNVTGNIQAESKKWDQAANQATGDISNSFSSMAGKIAGAFAAAGIGTALINFGKAAVDAASDLAEVQNVVDTVFGDGARQIESWAKSAGQQFGLTETQAKKFTSTLGAMMKSSGIAGDEIVNMSTDLAGLAADMASFYNLDFETAFEKIRSGISGETMPLKQLGINMSVANLEAFALAQGLDKTFSEMSQGEQTMLRYQYLMQATSDAQGDFERTADGFANAQRRIQSSLDTISTVAGTFILQTIEPLTSSVANFLAQITATPERTVLDDFNDIEVDTADKMASLQETYEKAEAIIKLIDEISKETVQLKDGSTITFEELFKDIGNVEKNGGDVRGYLESLGVDVDYVINKYNVWKESTRQLTSLVPALTSVIDSETGAIDGGTEALQRNLEEWKAAEEKKLAWTAYYAKARALEEKKAEMYTYEFDEGAARQRAQKARDALVNIYGTVFDENGNILERMTGSHKEKYELGGIDVEQADKDFEHYKILLANEKKAKEELERQTDDYSYAEEELAAGKQALIEKYGEEEQAAEDAGDAVAEYGNKSEEAWAESLKGAEAATNAIQAVIDHYNSVRDATEQAVNSVVKSFDKITTAWDTQSDLTNQETEALNKYSDVWDKWGSDNTALKAMKEYVDGGGELTAMELEAYEALVKVRNAQKELNDSMDQYRPEGMTAGLNSQIKFMQDYLSNLNVLKEWGLSDELLASLSDGSKESAQYLQGLVEGGPEAAQAVDELYKEVQSQKKSFVDSLTEQKLAADEVFSSLVEDAKTTMEGLDLGEEAENAMGKTVLGIAAGISNNVESVSTAVVSLMNALNPLSALGFTWGFSDGSFMLELGGVGSFATGLDYVPRDDFPAFLHEGEGILTKEENAVWQSFKNGQPTSVDYDVLGGVMRDNVKAGGDVYLEGRTVGHVISDIQGKSYRNLQRSGWQA